MPHVHEEHRKRLEEVELILEYLSKPENLTAPDGEHIRAIVAQRALTHIHHIINDE